ncbi:unnamed protein product, partial [Staurois parvus]
MQLPVLSCTFLTLSDREESTAENQQLSERGSAPIISALMIGAQQCHTQVPPTCAQQCTHLCHPAVSPPMPRSATHLCPPTLPSVPSNAPTCVTQQCHHLCPEVPPTCAH